MWTGLLSWTTGLLDGREKAEDSMELLDGRELDRAAGTRWSCWMGKRWTGLVVDERAQADHSMKLLNGRGVDRAVGRETSD